MSHAATGLVEHRSGTFPGGDGLQLYYQAWLPSSRPRAILINLHGLGDHSSLYPSLSDYFPNRATAVYAFDMRGNGRSPGQRAYLERWEDFRGDLQAFLARVRGWEPGIPVFLLGHSLGGLVVLDYAMHYPDGLTGVIAAAPPLGKLGVPPVLMALGRIMSRIWPRFSLEVGMDLSGLARDPAVIKAVLADPLFHRRGTARLSTEVTTAISRVHARARDLTVPLLVLHGSADRMVPPDGSREFCRKALDQICELREYSGAYHGLFADVDHLKVLTDVERWMKARLAGSSEGRRA